jgi:hypothetical protein
MADALKTEWIMDVRATVEPPIIIGEGPLGLRRAVPISGGTFEGPLLQGTVVPGGVDWQVMRSDEVLSIEARYHLRTDDGVILSVINRGMRHGPAEVIARLAAGQTVDPNQYYFRAIPEFEAPKGRYDWLNKAIFVTSGERYADGVVIHFHRVL